MLQNATGIAGWVKTVRTGSLEAFSYTLFLPGPTIANTDRLLMLRKLFVHLSPSKQKN
jgi:hypothetical protein